MHAIVRIALALSGAALMVTAATLPVTRNDTPAQAAVGGPVIIGGDDLTDHGEVDIDGNPLEGWLYIQRAIENIEPNVTRSNDNSIAALGSAPSTDTSDDAGAAIGVAADQVGMTVTYHDGGPAIEAFFDDLASGAVNPAIIYVSGDGASNDIDTVEEVDALSNNAGGINDFVNDGGGLMSHGSEFGWLQALIPGIIVVDDGSSDDLYFTPEGLAALPALLVSDINAGPWHNYFTGDLGGLDVLVRSSDINTCGGGEVTAMAVQECEDAPVIIGGARVSITDDIDNEPTATATSCIPAIPGYRCDGNPSSGSGSAQTPTAAPTGAATTAPPPAAATATPGGGTAGVGGGPVGITAPDTGDGSAAVAGTTPIAAMVLLATAGVTLLGASALGFRRKR